MPAIRPIRLDTVSADSAVRARTLREDPIVHYQIPGDPSLDAALATVEDLIDRGQPALALRHARSLDVSSSPLSAPYDFLRVEKIGRAALALGDEAWLGGHRDLALRHYNEAWNERGAHPAVESIAAVAREAIEFVLAEHGRLKDLLTESVRRGAYDDWCNQQTRLRDLSVFSVEVLRDRIIDDRQMLEEPTPHPGVEFIDRPKAIPGSVFRAAHAERDDAALSLRMDFGADSRVPAELAHPVIATLTTARARRFVVEHGLSLTGDAVEALPIFRYTYLRQKAEGLIGQIEHLDVRTHDVDARLDDLAAVFVKLDMALAQRTGELESLKRQKEDLIKQIVALTQLLVAAEMQRQALASAREDCSSDWWSWVAGAVSFITLPALAVGVAFSSPTIVAVGELGGVGGILAGLASGPINCSSIDEEIAKRTRALVPLQKEIEDRKAQLAHLSLRIEQLLQQIERLEEEHAQAQQQDMARVLSTQTLGAIRSQLNQVRRDLVTQASATAQLAQTAFNFEHDANLQVVSDSYLDPRYKGYAVGETLRRDLEGLEHFRLTSHKAKLQQLSHVISLRRHHTMAWVGFKATGRASFSPDIATFDRAFPGTYLQRTKEVRVEVLVDEKPVPARGYLSNAGISSVRLPEYAGRRVAHHSDLSRDPDPDVAKLCYMRLLRRQAPETAAFSAFESILYTDRLVDLQRQEHNFFENLGIETTWQFELLPDQDFDLANVTDVRLHIQYEALFDETLKRVLDDKRYVNRRETAMFSIRELAGAGPDADIFADPVDFRVRRERLEAPYLDKRIVDIGFLVTSVGGSMLSGAAVLQAALDGGAPIPLTTDAVGIVATAPDHPAGLGVSELAAAARGKSVHRPWRIQVADMPGGLGLSDVGDVMLLLQYEYVT
jgi:hypothetical protein